MNGMAEIYRNRNQEIELRPRDENIILMQSTGLKDKNGKEIFEGDIIRTSAYGCIVGFGEYTYFEDDDTQTTEIGFYLSFLNVTPATYAPFDKYYWDNCEVIGNIYENELDLIMYKDGHKFEALRCSGEDVIILASQFNNGHLMCVKGLYINPKELISFVICDDEGNQ